MRQFGKRLGQALLHLVEPLYGLFICIGRLAARHVRRRHEPDLLPNVVECKHLVEKQQASVGDSKFVLGELGQPLDLAHRVVGKKAYGAGSERRQARQSCWFVPTKRSAQHGKYVVLDLDDLSALGDRDLAPARHDPLERRQPDEGVAAHLLATLHRLQQKALPLRPRGAQKCRDWCFQVGGQDAADWHQGMFPGKGQKLLAIRLDGTV